MRNASDGRFSVGFIVPTVRRPNYLRLCLESIARQTVQPTAVRVGIRFDDTESTAVVEEFSDRLSVRHVEALGVGVIGSMASCLRETTEDYVVLLDDDVELPSDWLKTMLGHLETNSDLLAAAGRDFLQDDPEFRRTEKRVLDVGRFHWYGRMTGNHHRGGGNARRVDILRGSNCLFRGDFLREVGFEEQLRGKGAQVSWELALACHAMHRRKSFFYDPTIEVVHHVAPRLDADSLHRGGFDARATFDSAYNETYVTFHHAPGFKKWTGLLYQFAVGSPLAPGVIHFCRQAMCRRPHTAVRAWETIIGRLSGMGLGNGA